MFKAGYRKAHHSNITKDENMNQQTIDAINTLGNFCGKRDIEELTSSTLTEKYKVSCYSESSLLKLNITVRPE